jgi:hypothetical protein
MKVLVSLRSISFSGSQPEVWYGFLAGAFFQFDLSNLMYGKEGGMV